ncbi:MAG: hypothetical protein ACRC7G_11825, partial [Beijerinckiaceae bacterium]
MVNVEISVLGRRVDVKGRSVPPVLTCVAFSEKRQKSWTIELKRQNSTQSPNTENQSVAGSLPADVFNDGDDRVLIQFPEYANLKYEKVIRIGTSVLAGQVEGVSNGALFGWCSILSLLDCPQPILQLQIDGRTSRTALEWLDRHDLKLITLQQRSGFSFSLPDEVFDGNIHSVSAHLDNGRSIGKFQYRRHTIGRVDG